MTKLEAVFERLRQLPQAEQDLIIADIEAVLNVGVESPLSEAQQAELERRLADTDKKYVSHDEVVARFEQKFGR
jgi:putative addiction module component (TIGR02574 family)